MADQDVNALADVQGEVPAIPAEAEEAPQEVTPDPTVDDAPDPDKLKSEIAALQEQKKAAKEGALKWRREKAEARADYFKSREQQQPAPAPATPAQTAAPNQDDFDDYNDYVKAVADHSVEIKRQEWERDATKKSQDQAHQAKLQTMQEKINAGFDKYPDFEDVAMAPTVPITPMIMDILAETESPADIAYFLGKNHTETIRISRLTPIAAARAIAQIEAQIATPAAPATTPKPTTNAPPPITPVGSSNTAGGKKLEDMTQAEFEAHRARQGAKLY